MIKLVKDSESGNDEKVEKKLVDLIFQWIKLNFCTNWNFITISNIIKYTIFKGNFP